MFVVVSGGCWDGWCCCFGVWWWFCGSVLGCCGLWSWLGLVRCLVFWWCFFVVCCVGGIFWRCSGCVWVVWWGYLWCVWGLCSWCVRFLVRCFGLLCLGFFFLVLSIFVWVFVCGSDWWLGCGWFGIGSWVVFWMMKWFVVLIGVWRMYFGLYFWFVSGNW